MIAKLMFSILVVLGVATCYIANRGEHAAQQRFRDLQKSLGEAKQVGGFKEPPLLTFSLDSGRREDLRHFQSLTYMGYAITFLSAISLSYLQLTQKAPSNSNPRSESVPTNTTSP
jgi:hypothetical protein